MELNLEEQRSLRRGMRQVLMPESDSLDSSWENVRASGEGRENEVEITGQWSQSSLGY